MQWVSTSDLCHRSAVFSYALNSTATDQSRWVSDFNHFVLFDTQSLIACHDFEYIDLMPVRCITLARYCSALTFCPPILYYHMTAAKLGCGRQTYSAVQTLPRLPGSPKHQLRRQIQEGDWQQGHLWERRHGRLCAARWRLDAYGCHLDRSKRWVDNHISEWCGCMQLGHCSGVCCCVMGQCINQQHEERPQHAEIASVCPRRQVSRWQKLARERPGHFSRMAPSCWVESRW